MRAFVFLLCAAAGSVPAAAQDVQEPAPTAALHFTQTDSTATRLYTPAGESLSLDAMLARLDSADVLFVGEQHDDAVGHAFQRLLIEAAYSRYAGNRTVVLALEMFERDVQLVLDEYLAGLIREKDFLAAARPWSNYDVDYRPLVEAARAHRQPVVASNAPARYVSRLGRGGGLDSLSTSAREVLPPLPVEPASPALRDKFLGVMGAMAAMHMAPPAPPDSSGTGTAELDSLSAPTHHAMPAMDLGAMLAAQNLRDVSMAAAVADALARYPGALVVHVNGSFHSESGLGIPEHLARQRPDARAVVLTLVPVDDSAAFEIDIHGSAGDVIGLTGQPEISLGVSPGGEQQ